MPLQTLPTVEPPKPLKPIGWRIGVVAVLIIVGAAIGSYFWLAAPIPEGPPVSVGGEFGSTSQLTAEEISTAELELARMRAEARRNALAAGGGFAALGALLLAFRRQRHTEHQQQYHEWATKETHDQRERAAAAMEEDAEQRRITDARVRAVDQLGSDNSTIRIGGLHNLERIGEQHRELRQVVLDEICSYLRLPYRPTASTDAEQLGSGQFEPVGPPPEPDNTSAEREVRLIAQEILQRHLSSEDGAESYWEHLRLNLNNAHLDAIDFSKCRLKRVNFAGAVFSDVATFVGVTFLEYADFSKATFRGKVSFEDAVFSDCADFKSAAFTGKVDFGGVTFSEVAVFERTTYVQDADFKRASFADYATFRHATFSSHVFFGQAAFSDRAKFNHVVFAGEAGFGSVSFAQIADFRHAKFSGLPYFDNAKFSDNVYFGDAIFAAHDTYFRGITFSKSAHFEGAIFSGYVNFSRSCFFEFAFFQRVVFKGPTTFIFAKFTDKTDFTGSVFIGAADLTGATFTKDSDFGSVKFYQRMIGADLKLLILMEVQEVRLDLASDHDLPEAWLVAPCLSEDGWGVPRRVIHSDVEVSQGGVELDRDLYP